MARLKLSFRTKVIIILSCSAAVAILTFCLASDFAKRFGPIEIVTGKDLARVVELPGNFSGGPGGGRCDFPECSYRFRRSATSPDELLVTVDVLEGRPPGFKIGYGGQPTTVPEMEISENVYGVT